MVVHTLPPAFLEKWGGFFWLKKGSMAGSSECSNKLPDSIKGRMVK
jgi:hypothetical protein